MTLIIKERPLQDADDCKSTSRNMNHETQIRTSLFLLIYGPSISMLYIRNKYEQYCGFSKKKDTSDFILKDKSAKIYSF